MNAPILEFDWDDSNRSHLTRHDVTSAEAEQVILGDPLDIEMQTADGGDDDEERLLHLGETAKGRILQLLATWRKGKVRIISAWDAPQATQVVLSG